MRAGAEVEPLSCVTAAIRERIGAADDRLHFEHPFEDLLVGGRRIHLREDRAHDVILERDLAHHERAVDAHLHPDAVRPIGRLVGQANAWGRGAARRQEDNDDEREAHSSKRQRHCIGASRCKLDPVSRILVIDDDQGVRESMERMLRGAGYTVQSAGSGEEGFDLARGNAFDVILSDMRMPGISGIDVLQKLREQRVDSAFIVMTGFGTVDSAVEAMKLGAVDFVQKPFFRDELLMRVRSAADRRQLARQVDLLQRQIRTTGSLDALLARARPCGA